MTRDSTPAADVSLTHDQWVPILTLFLKGQDLPLELVAETADALAETLYHADILITKDSLTASLSELEDHPLRSLLEDQLSPLLPTTMSWSFLTSELIELYFSPRPPTSSLVGTRTRSSSAEGDGGSDESDTHSNTSRLCELCGREMPLTVHHLIPRSTHGFYQSHASLLPQFHPPRTCATKLELSLHQARVCRPCHSQIHRLVPDHRVLATEFGTVERLLTREDVRKWVSYISSQRVSDARMGKGLRYRR